MDIKKSSRTTNVVKGVVGVLIFLAFTFGSAGTFAWPEAWIFIGFYLVAVAAVLMWLKRNDPALLKERASAWHRKDVKTWDRIIIRGYSLVLVTLPVVAGFDAVRYRWSHAPLWLKILAFLGFIPSLVIGFWAMRENPYLSEMVRIQEERGHKVCTSGPYRYVRHPMYSGIIVFFICLPLALGSFYALIPAAIIVILFVIRTALEDRTLQQELGGYKEYTQRVHYKLIPFIW